MKKIVFTNPDGSVGVIIPTGELPVEACMKDVPANAINARIIEDTDLPQDRLFRSAWTDSNPESFVGVDLVKAKDVSHVVRRQKRNEEFVPHDEVITKQIPGVDLVAAEAARTTIRTKYDAIQLDIDAAADEVALRAVLTTNALV
jgi:hypothetical protein